MLLNPHTYQIGVEDLFGRHPVMMGHSLASNFLFTREALAELIDFYVRNEREYTLVQMGPQGSPRKTWQTGKIAGMKGRDVIDAIEQGRMWINLLHVNEVYEPHQRLLDAIYEEIADCFPEHPPTFKRISGVLISSPRAQVYYHFDTAGQNLWQIAGLKRVYLYPTTEPFITEKMLEHCMLYHDEVGVPYEPWYDHYAKVFTLTPGDMLHWQLNAPHRIENGDELSVSYTTEFFTRDIQRHVRGVSGNGLLRAAGLRPTRTPSGPAYLAKAALFAASKRFVAAKRGTPVEFTL